MNAPVATQDPSTFATKADASEPDGSVVALVSAEPKRGHPGRSLRPYRAKHGDTTTGPAVRLHAWTAELRRVNRLGRHAALSTGERIRVPVGVAAGGLDAARAGQARDTHQRRKPWRHSYATRAEVRRVIVLTARRHGVGERVALAISWQESGWQQRRRSTSGAIGAMQIMPGTGRWMSQHVNRRLNIYGLYDNVTAGVVLFKVLRTQLSWRRSIGAYYQGLGGVQRHGMSPATRTYTRNVVAHYRRLGRGWNPS